MCKPRHTEGRIEGHDQPCYYCNKPCNSFAGNPSLWPIPLCHGDDPGRVKWHHIGCVSQRLRQRDDLLAACKSALDALEPLARVVDTNPWIKELRAAIAKAEGGDG
jgi:hypothetical protein